MSTHIDSKNNKEIMIQNNSFYVLYTGTALPFVFRGESSLYKSNDDNYFIHKCGDVYYQYKRVNSIYQYVDKEYLYKGYTIRNLAHVLSTCDIEEADVLYQNFPDKEKESKLNIYYQMKLNQYKRYLSSYYNCSCSEFCYDMKQFISQSKRRFKMSEPEFRVFLKIASAALFYAEAGKALYSYRNAVFKVSVLPLAVVEKLLMESSLVAGGNHTADFCKNIKKIVEIK